MTPGQELIKQLAIPGYGQDEIGFMEETLCALRPSFIGDWGTNRGSSARIFWEFSRLHNFATVIHTVELPIELAPFDAAHPGRDVGFFLRGRAGIRRHTGDGVTEALAERMRRRDLPTALFFLDGDHLSESVFREIVMINRCDPRAWMILHDTREGPGAAIETFTQRFPDTYDVTYLGSQAGISRMVPR